MTSRHSSGVQLADQARDADAGHVGQDVEPAVALEHGGHGGGTGLGVADVAHEPVHATRPDVAPDDRGALGGQPLRPPPRRCRWPPRDERHPPVESCPCPERSRWPVGARRPVLCTAMGALEGKVAVVTGAAMGIGRASALVFAREGAQRGGGRHRRGRRSRDRGPGRGGRRSGHLRPDRRRVPAGGGGHGPPRRGHLRRASTAPTTTPGSPPRWLRWPTTPTTGGTGPSPSC